MTRANVVIKHDDKELFLYRHSDGYPEGLGMDLTDCLVPDDPIATIFNILKECSLELTDGIHGDIEYLYTITLEDHFILMSYEKL